MGSLGDNGGGWSPDGGMPELPPEWRDIVIPDDLSALADEAAAVRAELYRDRHRSTWQRLVGHWQHFVDRPPVGRWGRGGSTGLRVPILIITLSVLVTIASLFASTWPGTNHPTAAGGTGSGSATDHHTLPALKLQGADGEMVALRDRLPAVILLIDGCDCTALVRDTAAAVRSDIAVVTVAAGTAPRTTTSASAVPPGSLGSYSPGGSGLPGAAGRPASLDSAVPLAEIPPRPADTTVHRLWDPTGQLRAAFDLNTSPDGTAAALLVDTTGRIVRTVPRTISVEDLRPDLARLT